MIISRQLRVLAAMTILACSAGCVQKDAGAGAAGAGTAGGQTGASQPFAEARILFEQNATDGDVEIVLEAKAGDEGLSSLTVKAPDGRTIVDFTAPGTSTLGMRQFRFETPEPKDAGSLKAAYPEGAYTLTGVGASAKKYAGSATLSHQLPATASFLHPGADAENVNLRGLVLKWSPVPNIDAYVVYIEQDELRVSINSRLPGSATSFAVPDGFLAPATEYTMGLGTVTKDGNASYVEAQFTTAAK